MGLAPESSEQQESDVCVQMTCLVAKAARAGPRGMACFVRKTFAKNNVYQTPSQQSSCESASFWLASVHVMFVFFFSLQAVETNLASKDSHWVFVNEVRAQSGEAAAGSEPLAP